MTTEELESWDDFLARIDSLIAERDTASANDTGHSELLFRGHADSQWPLSTTLERWTGADVYLRRYHRGLTAIQHEFESRIGRTWEVPDYPSFESLLEDGEEKETEFFRLLDESELYEYMVYLRHHGFPSPLLDWTRSPYIAAYFAFARATPESKVVIYAYQEHAGQGKVVSADAPRIQQIGPHVRTHARHFQQQADYTVAIQGEGREMRYCAHEAALRGSGGRQQDLTWRIEVPGSERKRALRYLELHNLTAYSLFGSDEALAESLAIREFILSKE